MAKISFVLLFITLFTLTEAYRPLKFITEAPTPSNAFAVAPTPTNTIALAPTPTNAIAGAPNSPEIKTYIQTPSGIKEIDMRRFEYEVGMLGKSEVEINKFEEALKSGKNVQPYATELKKYNKRIDVDREESGSVAIIKLILRDLGFKGNV